MKHTGKGLLLILAQLDEGPKSITELSRVEGVSRGTVQNRLQELIDIDVVEKEVDMEDTRKARISLKGDGKAGYHARKLVELLDQKDEQ